MRRSHFWSFTKQVTDYRVIFLGLAFVCSFVTIAPFTYGAEQDPTLVVLYSDTDDEILSEFKADIKNITNMAQIDVQRVEIHTTSRGEICAVVVDKDYNKHSAYYITEWGMPKYLYGEDREICFRNTETLHNILTFSSPDLDVMIIIIASISVVSLLVFAFMLQKSRQTFFRFRLPKKIWVVLILFGAVGGVMIILVELVQKFDENAGLIVMFLVGMYLLIVSVLAGLNLSHNPSVKWYSD